MPQIYNLNVHNRSNYGGQIHKQQRPKFECSKLRKQTIKLLKESSKNDSPIRQRLRKKTQVQVFNSDTNAPKEINATNPIGKSDKKNLLDKIIKLVDMDLIDKKIFVYEPKKIDKVKTCKALEKLGYNMNLISKNQLLKTVESLEKLNIFKRNVCVYCPEKIDTDTTLKNLTDLSIKHISKIYENSFVYNPVFEIFNRYMLNVYEKKIDEKDNYFRNAPFLAYKNKNFTVLKFLDSIKVDFETTNYQGCTVLMEAVRNEDVDMVKALIDLKEVNVNFKQQNGSSAIHFAARNGLSDIIALLLEKGADINEKERNGWTPLSFAMDSEKKSTVKFLLENGANPNAIDRYNKTAFSQAIRGSDLNLIKLMFKHGANVNLETKKGPPIYLAFQAGKAENVQWLLENGANHSGLLFKEK